MDLTIRRSEWLRGEGGPPSRLLRPSDEKLCCVGIYLRELGVPACDLSDQIMAEERHVTPSAQWLIDDGNATEVDDLYSINDAICLLNGDDYIQYEKEREAQIAHTFANHDVHVKFVD